MHQLMTVGYEGLSGEQFFSLLLRNRIETVVDVRELPLSRKPGFSKNSLAAACQARGIGYVHMPPLGCPRPVRHAYRVHGDWAVYTEGFLRHLAHQAEAMRELACLAESARCCLLCFEADPNFCHRSLVAARLHCFPDLPFQTVHLSVAHATT